MNLKHLVALIKLRYQLSYNQVKKAGKLNLILSILALIGALICAVSALFIGVFGGAIWFQEASVTTILITWNAIVLAFLVMWTIGLLVELQQTELMSIDKLLHLPISLREAFLLNYTSSFVNTTFIMFTPLMIGLSLGLVLARGPAMMLSLPLVIGFLFLITTLTYQLRGWLARIMENKRTRGTVIAVITIGFIMLSQIPNLINISFQRSGSERRKLQQVKLEEIRELGRMEIDARIIAGEIQLEENGYWVERLESESKDRMAEKKQKEKDELFAYGFGLVEKADAYAPPGWLPLGIARASQGKMLPGLLGTLAMFVIGFLSLAFSYRTSMRKYTGVESKRRRKKSTKSSEAKQDDFLFKNLPFCSEQVSAVALASFRGFLRAPESKMALIFPLIMVMLGSSFLIGKGDVVIPALARPWIAVGVVALTMFALVSMLFNQFGVDRDGFRAFVLSPVNRKDILIGKNIGLAPLAIGTCVFFICVVQIFVPQGIFWLAASILQVPAVYALNCMLGNSVSIFFPMGIKRGTMQPANPRFVPMLIMILGVMLAPTVLMLPTTLACGIPTMIEAATNHSMGWLFLILTAIQLGLTLVMYKWILGLQENWLWKRESKILDVVANIPGIVNRRSCVEDGRR